MVDRVVACAALMLVACPADDAPAGEESGTTLPTSTSAGTTTPPATTASTGESTATPTPPASSTTGTSTGPGQPGTSGSGSSSSTGPQGCTKTVVLMGYWPPTNEMLRPWSTNDEQNPGGWVGEDWRGHGFDVHAFFPEFPPDGDPSNDPIGSEGSVGSMDSDLRVDYQDTSADFWRIVDELQPLILISTSRGGDIGWEIEAIEGGHGEPNPDPSDDWLSDEYLPVLRPTMASVEERTWDAIFTWRVGMTLGSSLPLKAIETAASELALTSVQIDNSTSGAYLSGFLGLHSVYYAHENDYVVAGGHIHVGFAVPVADASALIETTLETVLEAHPADTLDCAPTRR